MQAAVADAKLIIFLGFGYHTSNVDLIKSGPTKSGAVVMGTVTGIHNSNHMLIAGRIAGNLNMPLGQLDLHNIYRAVERTSASDFDAYVLIHA